MDDTIYRILALRVRQERRRAGYTLEQLGERAGITGAFVAHIEAARKRATLDTVAKLARAFDIQCSSLLEHGSDESDSARRGANAYAAQLARLTRNMSARQREAFLELARAGARLLDDFKARRRTSSRAAAKSSSTAR